MDIQHDTDQNRFIAETAHGTAELAYVMKDDAIAYVHTLVPKAARGQNIGTALVEHGLGYARDNGLLVIPQCPFVKAYMDGHPETDDLRA